MIVQTVQGRALPVVERANAWLAERSERERRMLSALAVVAVTALCWYVVLQPILQARQTAVARIELYEGLQARLRAAPPGSPPSPGAGLVAGPLDEAARQAAAAQGLTAVVSGDAARVDVSISDARFDSAVPFVHALESGGVVIDDLRMQTGSQAGLVSLTLTAARP